MRGHQLAGAFLAAAVMGCSVDSPTEAGRPQSAVRVTVAGARGEVDLSYEPHEAKELRRTLLKSVREDRPLARGRRNQVMLQAFASAGDQFHYALVYGKRTGPPRYSVLMKNGKPFALIRYDWEKRGREWQTTSSDFTFFSEKGKPVIAGRAERDQRALDEVAAVVERVTVAMLTRMVQPAHAQLEIRNCLAEYLELAAAAAALAVAISAPDPTLLTKLLIVTLTSAYFKAIAKLDDCVERHQGDANDPLTGSGGGVLGGGGEGWVDGTGSGTTGGTSGSGIGGMTEAEFMKWLRAFLELCGAGPLEKCRYEF